MIGNMFQFAWEVKLIEWCQSNIPSFLINILSFISNVGDTVILVGILAFFYLCFDKKLGRKLLFNTITSLMFACELKNIFKRRRPYFDNKNIKCLKVVEKDYDMFDIRKQGFSFPSLHSSNITVITGTIYQFYKKHYLLTSAIVFSMIVGVSRFILGCHYPTDVLTGMVIGIISIVIIGRLQDKLDTKYLYIIMLIMMAIGFTYCESADYYSTCGIALGFIGADIIDHKYNNFENTRNIIRIVARLVFACVVFLAISEGLKIPFSEDVLEANTLFAHAYRTLRYGIASFVALGITPLIYKRNIFNINA